MAGYTRQSEAGIVDGGIISANDLNAEFDQIETAMGALGHSHSGASGEGPQISTAGIADSAVTTVKINDGAVTTAKIADANVTNAKLATDSVTTAKIVDGNVTNAKIGLNAVTLGTQTTGNYVATVAGTSPINVSGSGSETAAVTVSVNDASTTGKGVAQFNSTDFAVTGGVVTLNKDPVITLTGAVTGSGTMTNLGSVSITTSSSPTLTLNGDVSGSATFTNLANATLTVTVANDSHTHDTRYYTETEVGNFFGGTTAITGYNKSNWDTAYGWGNHASAGYQAAATAITTTTSFGGDVSGTYNNIVVADDSHNHIISNVDGLQDALDLKAPLDSPVLSGVPTAPTAAASNNTTQIATTSFVKTQISLLVDSSPATLDTLNELAAALGDDPNFATTVSNSIGLKAPIDSPTFTGVPAAPTAATGTNTTQLSTTAFVQQEIAASLVANSNGVGTRTVSTSDPTGGSDGDIWYKYTA